MSQNVIKKSLLMEKFRARDITLGMSERTIKSRYVEFVSLLSYSPELNPAETLWRILKGKWIRPRDYETTDSLFYCTNRAFASVGTNLLVNYSYS